MSFFKKNKTTYVIINMMIQFFIETFVGIVIGYFIGRAIDNWLFEDQQIFMYIFMVFGIFGAFRNLVIRSLKITGGEGNEKNDEHH